MAVDVAICAGWFQRRRCYPPRFLFLSLPQREGSIRPLRPSGSSTNCVIEYLFVPLTGCQRKSVAVSLVGPKMRCFLAALLAVRYAAAFSFTKMPLSRSALRLSSSAVIDAETVGDFKVRVAPRNVRTINYEQRAPYYGCVGHKWFHCSLVMIFCYNEPRLVFFLIVCSTV